MRGSRLESTEEMPPSFEELLVTYRHSAYVSLNTGCRVRISIGFAFAELLGPDPKFEHEFALILKKSNRKNPEKFLFSFFNHMKKTKFLFNSLVSFK